MVRSKATTVRIGARSLEVSNLDKVLYPATGTTKGDVMGYLLDIAPLLLPQLARRPVTRKRWVDGVGTPEAPGPVFFRKDLEAGAPSWIPTGTIAHRDHANTYPLADEPAVLVWFAQLAALELHVPQWRFSADGTPANPDRLVIDLDPGPGVGLPECATVAHAAREMLLGMGLDTVPVTSGSKGIHLYAPLDGRSTSQQVSAVAQRIARELEADLPELVVSTQQKSRRQGKVLVDWSQNSGNKTTICPYSLRGRMEPTVACPRTWDELGEPGLRQLRHEEVLERAAAGLDPLAGQGLPLGDDRAQPMAADPLKQYRRKRSATRTPEPVPARGGGAVESGEPIFVIQEHHATRLHWDFRLERDGVLMSWAVPKGPPLEHDLHRLAVQTEDHPYDYASFEGTIPEGEYGGGTVEIWDSGTIEVEKWTEKEIIVVLQGRATGGLGGIPRRYVLVRTKGDGERSQWLLQLTKQQPGSPETVPSWTAGSELPAPMLATAGTELDIDDGMEWAIELKWDGVRAICAVSPDGVRLVSRSGKDMTGRYPELAELPLLLHGQEAILDGEIVALDADGRPSFSRLQPRMTAKVADAARLREDIPVTFMVFDLLQLSVEGRRHDLLGTPYAARRRLLERALDESPHVRVPPAFDGGLEAARAHVVDAGLEGVVAKRCASPYVPGQRSRSWVKIKSRPHQAVVIVGWRVGDGGLRSLLLGIRDEQGHLRYAGRVGSGLTAHELRDLEARLRRIERKTPAVDVPAADAKDARWVTPRFVGEVAHAGRTREGRLRQPSWHGLRPDLDAVDIAWEC